MIKDRDGLTWRELADRARQKGAPVPTGLFHLGNPDRPMQDFPRTKTIMGVAAALEVEPDVVAAAALESLNLQQRNVVDVHVKNARIHTGGTNPEVGGQPGERWVIITPDDETPQDVLNAFENATNLRVVLPKDASLPAETA
ncbi:hypothetical protein CFP71_21215 [Amycolatopsis thailandensis]|uniref:Uncharacterized protein n=2 Tax=Pseudonocardiaceae TaxID=2070 RepID=A0A229S557_9PSEU|nr:hypothetical protein CFP71_21215 [Amycolatopsis thailandensis]